MLSKLLRTNIKQKSGNDSHQIGTVGGNAEINSNNAENGGILYSESPINSHNTTTESNNSNCHNKTNKFHIPLWQVCVYLVLTGAGFGGGALVTHKQLIPKVAAAEQKADGYKKQLNELQQTGNKINADSQEQIKNLKQQIADQQQTSQEQQNKILRQKNLIKDKNSEIENLNTQIQKLKAQVETLSNQPLQKPSTSNGNQTDTTTQATPVVAASPKTCTGNFVTKDKLAKMRTGMSVDEVSTIIGAQPVERVKAVQLLTTWRWRKDCNTSIDLTFSNLSAFSGLTEIPAWTD